jgi:hypothetical protein
MFYGAISENVVLEGNALDVPFIIGDRLLYGAILDFLIESYGVLTHSSR